MNRFAHLRGGDDTPPEDVPVQATEVEATAIAPPSTPSPSVPELVESPELDLELAEVGHLVERKVGILGKVPASVKDAYDAMLLQSRKYIGRPNADLAVQAWVELTLEDEAFRKRWLRRMQDLRKK